MIDILDKDEISIYSFYYGSYVNIIDAKICPVKCIGGKNRIRAKLKFYESMFLQGADKIIVYSNELLDDQSLVYLSNNRNIKSKIVHNNRIPSRIDLSRLTKLFIDHKDDILNSEKTCVIALENLNAAPYQLYNYLESFLQSNLSYMAFRSKLVIIISLYDDD